MPCSCPWRALTPLSWLCLLLSWISRPRVRPRRGGRTRRPAAACSGGRPRRSRPGLPRRCARASSREYCSEGRPHVGERRRRHRQARGAEARRARRRAAGRPPPRRRCRPACRGCGPASPTSRMRRSTAGCHGSWNAATEPSSRSAASVYWVRSFVPIEAKSRAARTRSASERRRRHLDHDAGGPDAVVPGERGEVLGLLDRRDHRRHDPEVGVGRGIRLGERGELLAQDVLARAQGADAAQPERRVLLVRVVEERRAACRRRRRAPARRPSCRGTPRAAACRTPAAARRVGAWSALEEEELGAEQADALGAERDGLGARRRALPRFASSGTGVPSASAPGVIGADAADARSAARCCARSSSSARRLRSVTTPAAASTITVSPSARLVGVRGARRPRRSTSRGRGSRCARSARPRS